MGNHFSEGLLGKSEKDLFVIELNTIKDEEISSDLPNYEPFVVVVIEFGVQMIFIIKERKKNY